MDPASAAHIFSLQISNGGVPKLPIREALVTASGLAGDAQRNTRVHGGPERALCLYSLEAIVQLQSKGHPIYPGSIGENVTIAGLDWPALSLGDRLVLADDVIVEISSYTLPCQNIAASFLHNDFSIVSPKRNQSLSRLYVRVLQGGLLRVGQPVLWQPAIAREV
jgi:MOSC domain-containing protein YiiM